MTVVGSLKSGILAHRLTRGMELDDPRTTAFRRRIIWEKKFLRRLYEEWYGILCHALPAGEGGVLELGSGAGFLRDVIPGLITSDILPVEGIDVVLGDDRLPFADGALRAIVMTNVLHHIATPRRFFAEAARTVRAGGAVIMIEPWVTPWSRWVYRHLHHEPINPDAVAWEFEGRGPLSSANTALPWILFHRDRARFEEEFPAWTIERVRPLMPFSYLLSGGVSLRSAAPGILYGLCRGLERLLEFRAGSLLAMFAEIVLRRRAGGGAPRGDGRISSIEGARQAADSVR